MLDFDLQCGDIPGVFKPPAVRLWTRSQFLHKPLPSNPRSLAATPASTSINPTYPEWSISTSPGTPQLKVLQKCIDAYATLDIGKVEPVLSKNYIHETFPKSIGLPDETKEEYIKSYIKRYEEMLSSFTVIEVRIQHRRTAVVRLVG